MRVLITIFVGPDDPNSDDELIGFFHDDPLELFDGAEWKIERESKSGEVKRG